MTTFQYSCLNSGQVRLLELMPGVGTAPLAGELLVVELGDYHSDPNHGMSFEAISYVWGDNDKAHSLGVSNGSIGLTKSLHSFLTRLRLEDKSRLLWADAVCINQDDPLDKEHQVGIMSTIYSTARCVLADLGEASPDLEIAIQLMDRCWRKFIWAGAKEDRYGRDLSPEELAFFVGLRADELQPSAAADELPEQDDKQWEAVKSFYARDWFSRLWVIQEFVLARDIIFYCGPHCLDWRHLLAIGLCEGPPESASVYGTYSLHELHSAGIGFFVIMGCIRRLRMLKQTLEGRQFIDSLRNSSLWNNYVDCNLIALLESCRPFKCTLERDRYFALLKLSSDFSGDCPPDLAPDYRTNTDDLILRFGRFLIQQTDGAEMFLRSGLWTRQDSHVPTWMQDFARSTSTVYSLSSMGGFHKAAGDGGFAISFCHDSSNGVNLKGYMVDEVWDVASIGTAMEEDLGQYIQQYIKTGCETFAKAKERIFIAYPQEPDALNAPLMALCANTQIGPEGDQLRVALWRTMLETQPKGSRSLEEILSSFGWSPWWTQDVTLQNLGGKMMRLLLEMLAPLLQGLLPATTKRGYFANLPPIGVPGDEIWIIQGCRMPVLMRKSQDYPTMFRLVGACYCQGVMDGELLHREGFGFGDVQIH